MSALWFAAIFAVVLAVLVVGFLAMATYNSLVTLEQQVSKAWANIDVALKQRHDELPNLVDAVRDLMAYEQETVTRVVRARAAYSPNDPIPAQAETSAETSAAVRRLFAVVEQYPQIHSQQNVMDLQNEIERLEAVIAARRELYNDTVYLLNTRIGQFPGNLIAALFGWRPRRSFTASPDDRTAPAVGLPPGPDATS